MSSLRGGREFDLVLFGATGFTGALTAEYLARHAPAGTRWAIAGRDLDRLRAIAARLVPLNAGAPPVGVIRADSGDWPSLASLAESSRVVASTVGPFMTHGAPLVGACAQAGTDYLDIAGEPEFVDRMWLAHHATASRRGARLVHACGFDAVPHDLGVWFTLRQLPEGQPLSIAGFVRAHASFSAGTYHSAVRAFGRARDSSEVARRRREREQQTAGSRSAGAAAAGADTATGRRRVGSLPLRPRRVPGTARWAVPLPTIDPIVVLRSARTLDRYGPDFRYGHFADVGGLPMVAASMAGVGGLLAAAQLPPLRAALLKLKGAGSGPDERRRAQSWFRVRFVSTITGDQDAPVLTEVSGGDPGYDETAKMLAESALSLAFDDALPDLAGQLTPVQAMGDALLARLQRAGMSFRTVPPSAQ